MSREIELWDKVSADDGLLTLAAGCDASDVSAVAALRKRYSADEVSAALELVAARARAVDKFGQAVAGRLVADVAGIEQASSSVVARYKAERFRKALGRGARVADLCCGIGGDSMALFECGLAVKSVDCDPLRAWMAGRNTGGRAEAVCADVAEVELDVDAIHLDPARRDEATGKRLRGLDAYLPGREVIGQLIEQAPSAAIKLSPAVDLGELSEQGWPGEVEFISQAGRLVQAVLWTGGLATQPRRATLIDGEQAHTLAGEPTVPRLTDLQRYLYTFDAAVERADLIGQLSQTVGAGVVHPRLGLLASEDKIDSPWLTGFELVEQMPWRPKRVRQWLKQNDGGLVEVKTRGKACDPDREQRSLRGAGGTTYTVFVLRFDTKVKTLITRRMGD